MSTSSSGSEAIHVVRQGECIHSIAWRFGIPWENLWNHSANDSLRRSRTNPSVLCPGDVVRVPLSLARRHPLEVGRNNQFRANLPQLHVRLVLRQPGGEARSRLRCTVEIDGVVHPEFTTDGQGFLDVPVRPDARVGTLTVHPEDGPVEVYHLAIGNLDPITEPTGVQARLSNLGHDVGPLDGVIGPRTEQAIRAFQESAGLAVTGLLDDETRARLGEAHND